MYVASPDLETNDIHSLIHSFICIRWYSLDLDVSIDPFDEFHERPDLTCPLPDGSLMLDPLKIKPAVVAGLRPSLPPIEEACPEGFASIITRCWATNPRERPSFDTIVSELLAMLKISSDYDHGQSIPSYVGSQMSASGVLFTPRVPIKADSVAPQLHPVVSELFTYKMPTHTHATALCATYDTVWVGCNTGDMVKFNISDCGDTKQWRAHTHSVQQVIAVGNDVWSMADDGFVRVWDAQTVRVGFPRASSFALAGNSLTDAAFVATAFLGARTTSVPVETSCTRLGNHDRAIVEQQHCRLDGLRWRT